MGLQMTTKYDLYEFENIESGFADILADNLPSTITICKRRETAANTTPRVEILFTQSGTLESMPQDLLYTGTLQIAYISNRHLPGPLSEPEEGEPVALSHTQVLAIIRSCILYDLDNYDEDSFPYQAIKAIWAGGDSYQASDTEDGTIMDFQLVFELRKLDMPD
jgi:hypothetical protein